MLLEVSNFILIVGKSGSSSHAEESRVKEVPHRSTKRGRSFARRSRRFFGKHSRETNNLYHYLGYYYLYP